MRRKFRRVEGHMEVGLDLASPLVKTWYLDFSLVIKKHSCARKKSLRTSQASWCAQGILFFWFLVFNLFMRSLALFVWSRGSFPEDLVALRREKRLSHPE